MPAFGTQAASNVIGSIEIVIGGLLIARFIDKRLSAAGALGAVATFLVTLSFMFTTPGVLAPDVGTLALTIPVGQFLLKDLGLLALSAVLLNESISAS